MRNTQNWSKYIKTHLEFRYNERSLLDKAEISIMLEKSLLTRVVGTCVKLTLTTENGNKRLNMKSMSILLKVWGLNNEALNSNRKSN